MSVIAIVLISTKDTPVINIIFTVPRAHHDLISISLFTCFNPSGDGNFILFNGRIG